MRTRPHLISAVLVLAIVASACSSGSTAALDAGTTSTTSGAASSSSTSSTAPASSTGSSSSSSSTTSSTAPASSTGSTTSTSAGGCGSGSSTIPAGAVSQPVIDVDGDGQPDTAWMTSASTGVVTVGIATAAGGGTQRTWDSASPVTRTLLVVSVNADTAPVLLADDGRTVQLWAFDDCSIVDVSNPEGDPYTFSLGFTDYGTGIGCREIAGTNELVGLDAKPSDDGSTVDWSSTVVTLNGTEAANGAISTGTYSSPADDAQIDLLHDVTCGSATVATDGLTLAS